jgi:hypothetical protein
LTTPNFFSFCSPRYIFPCFQLIPSFLMEKKCHNHLFPAFS